MSKIPKICIFYGGVGNERPVSLDSGKAVIAALQDTYDVVPHDLRERNLPEFIDPQEMIVLPVLHGSFGENGEMQALLEERGIEYCGCGSKASALCMDKAKTKHVVSSVGVHVSPSITFAAESIPSFERCVEALGDSFVIKPTSEGSSVGLYMIETASDYLAAVKGINNGAWMAESRIEGLETSVGILSGKAQGIVAIRPAGGVYDYAHKYTEGASTYEYPARIAEALTHEILENTERVFSVCGCRDYARVDFIVNLDEKPTFLEINSLPGLTPTSLLPKSATCSGLSFVDLLNTMLSPAISRWTEKHGK